MKRRAASTVGVRAALSDVYRRLVDADPAYAYCRANHWGRTLDALTGRRPVRVQGWELDRAGAGIDLADHWDMFVLDADDTITRA